MPFFLMVSRCNNAILYDHYSLVQFLQSIHCSSVLPAWVHPHPAQEGEVMFQLIPEGGVLVVDLHASQLCLLDLLLEQVPLL